MSFKNQGSKKEIVVVRFTSAWRHPVFILIEGSINCKPRGPNWPVKTRVYAFFDCNVQRN